MPSHILMPALSPTMEEGKLAKWMKSEGDEVSAGDVIAEIETDKATMEVEAVDEGPLGKILVPAGTEGVKVNTPIARSSPRRGRLGRRNVATPPPLRRNLDADHQDRKSHGRGRPTAKPSSKSPQSEPELPADTEMAR